VRETLLLAGADGLACSLHATKLKDVVSVASVAPKVRKMRTGLSKEAKERRLKEKKRRHELKESRRKKFDMDF